MTKTLSDQVRYLQLKAAAVEYIGRRRGQKEPKGSYDKRGRWYMALDEKRDCCDHIRYPSAACPYSLLRHCRTMQHIAQLYDVDLGALRTMVATARKGV